MERLPRRSPMKEMTRRGLLAGTPIAGLALATALPGNASAEDKPAARDEQFWIGPFPLRDWYKTREDKKSPFNVGTGPSYDEIMKSLNECRVYLLERRTADKSGRPQFGEHPYPRVALEGKLFHSWTVDGKDFAITILGGESMGRLTTYGRSPAVREVKVVQIKFRYDGENWLVRGTVEQPQNLGKSLMYDINGKYLPGQSIIPE
jgi:hypothetical protein